MSQLFKKEAQVVNSALMDMIPGGVAKISPTDKRVLYASEGLFKLSGYTRGEFEKSPEDDWYNRLIFPGDREKVERESLRQLTEKRKMEMEYRMQRKDGSLIWVKLYAGLMLDDEHGLCMVCLFFDDTESKAAAVALERTTQELNMLMNIIPGGVAKMAINDDFRILVASEGYYRMTGYTPKESEEAPFFGKGKNLVLKEDLSTVAAAVEELLRTGQTTRAEYRIRRKNGEVAWNTAYCSNIEQVGGDTLIEAVFIDTTAAKDNEHRLVSLMNGIPGGVAHVTVGDDLIIDYASDGFYRLSGYTRDEVEEYGMEVSALRLIHPDDRATVMESSRKFLASGKESFVFDFRTIPKDGGVRWIRSNATGMDTSGDERKSLQCVFTDITEIHETELQLSLNEQRYRIVSEQAQEVIFEWNMETGSIYHSPVYEKKFGYALPEDNTLVYLVENEIVHKDDKKRLLDMMGQLQNGEPFAEAEYRMRKANSEYIWCRVRATAIFNDEHKAVRAIGLITDIDDYKRETDLLKRSAQKDLLTDLLNKMTTQSRIAQCLLTSDESRCHALYLMDIDDFKWINDHLGHSAGDAVLTEVAARIRRQFSGTEIIGRIGGDEFVVFIEDVTSEEQLRHKAERLLRLFHRCMRGEKEGRKLSGSLGIALYPKDGRDFQTLYENADAALYFSKRRGKDCYSFYSELKEQE